MPLVKDAQTAVSRSCGVVSSASSCCTPALRPTKATIERELVEVRDLRQVGGRAGAAVLHLREVGGGLVGGRSRHRMDGVGDQLVRDVGAHPGHQRRAEYRHAEAGRVVADGLGDAGGLAVGEAPGLFDRPWTGAASDMSHSPLVNDPPQATPAVSAERADAPYSAVYGSCQANGGWPLGEQQVSSSCGGL